jgi:NADPH2:quinone reductase
LTYSATTEELRQSSQDLFSRVLNGAVQIEINQRYSLADIQQAHRDIEGRKTTGSTVILP